jgi:hypothetical protein
MTSTSPLREDNDHHDAVVPHLAAHVGALTAITECHTDYLSDNVHLFNVSKWKLIASVVIPLCKMQSLRYNFRAVRTIISCIHSSWNTCYFETASDSNEFAKQLFIRSERLETTESIKVHQQNPSSYLGETEKNLARESVDTTEDVKNVRKTTAYDRIKKVGNDKEEKHTSEVSSDSESEESEERSDESENSKVDQRETKSKWGLVSSVFKFGLLSGGKSKLSKRSAEESNYSDEQEDTSELDEQNEGSDAKSEGQKSDSSDNEEEGSGEDEDGDDEEESSTDRHSKGNKYTFKSLLEKLSLK